MVPPNARHAETAMARHRGEKGSATCSVDQVVLKDFPVSISHYGNEPLIIWAHFLG